MTLDELELYLEELESQVERKIEWTLTNHISLADARRYTGSMQLTINALKEKVKELKIIDTFNEESA
jgi:hypothetical protein|tara:strand:+ start:776 stop:976 length:201 start_codon:yes stop_codon:yes gene_type:complete